MLNLRVTVDNIQQTNLNLGRVFVNVNENSLPVSKNTILTQHDIPLAHLGKVENVMPKDIISIRYDLTKSTPLRIGSSQYFKINSPAGPSYYLVDKNTFNFSSRNVLATAIFNDFDEPLFYRHEIALTSINEVDIIDNQGNNVPANKYKILKEVDYTSPTHDSLKSIVAHTLKTDLSKGLYYKIITRNSTGQIIEELLNEEPLFKEESKYLFNQSLNTFSLNDEANLLVYWINQDNVNYTFTFPDDYQTCAYKRNKESFIHAKLPKAQLPNEPWYVLVPNSNWITIGGFYKLSEWDFQNFLPYKPFKYIQGDYAEIVDKNIIQLSNNRLFKSLTYNSITEYIYIEIYKENDERPTKAITNDPSKDGQLVSNDLTIFWEYLELSVNYEQGLIYSNEPLNDFSWCIVDYPCESEYLEVYLKDLNPFRDSSLSGMTVVYYLVPSFDGQERSVEYIVYDEDLVVVETSQNGTDSNNPDLSSEITSGLMYRKPTGTNFLYSEKNTLGIKVFTYKSNVSFVDHYVRDLGYIVLGEFSFNDKMDESPESILTDVRKYTKLDPIDVRNSNPEQLTILEDVIKPNTIQLEELFGLQEYRIHWSYFKEYVASALFDKAEAYNRLRNTRPAGLTASINYEGVPALNISNIDLVNKDITLSWLPVARAFKKETIGGRLYKGTDVNSIITLIDTIEDISNVSSYEVAFGSDDKLFLRLEPFISRNGSTYTGPSSNVISFSFI